MYQKRILPGGVRLIYERMPHTRSAALGIWVGSGSRFEPAGQAGISHLIEHMMFKGTDTRTAGDIAREMDALGGRLNAFTGKECTCYHFKALDEHLLPGARVLCDMLFSSRFAPAELETEKGVVYEEIGMYDDSPEDVAIETLFESCFQGSGLGRPILGWRRTLEGLDGADLHRHVRAYYRPEQTVVALCGSIPDEVLDFLAQRFSHLPPADGPRQDAARYHRCALVREREFEQNHLCIGFPSLPAGDEDRYALAVLSAILGGGMSSRLFQSVREERGLCYSIYSFQTAHADVGLFNLYTALSPASEEQALRLIAGEIERLCRQGPTQEEMDRARTQSRANILLSLEDSEARMNHQARGELLLGQAPDQEELAARHAAVTAEQVTELARRLLRLEDASVCAVGRVRPPEWYQNTLLG